VQPLSRLPSPLRGSSSFPPPSLSRLFLRPAYLSSSLSFLSELTLRIAILELDSLEKTVDDARPARSTSLWFAKLFPSRFMRNNATQIKDDRTQTHPAIFKGGKRNRSVCVDFVAKVGVENKMYAERSRFHLLIIPRVWTKLYAALIGKLLMQRHETQRELNKHR